MAGASPSPHEALYSCDMRMLLAIRNRQWKHHRRFRTDNAGYWPMKQGPFLFDLYQDSSETYSLVDSGPEIATELAMMLNA